MRTPDAPTAVGTVVAGTVKDAGMKSHREFGVTESDPPNRIRWTEQSKNPVTAEGGYDLQPVSETTTRVRSFDHLEGHGLGKLLAGLALSAARKDAPAFGLRIKAAVEAS